MISKSTPKARKPLKPSAPEWVPHNYQKKGVKWLLEHPAAALFLDPGMGKTSITYAALKILIAKQLSPGALVIAPLRPARSVWPKEQAKWSNFAGLRVCVLHGKEKEQLVHERYDVYVINHDGLAWLIENGHLERLLKNKWIDTLVMDELSKFKATNTKRFKMMKKWLGRFARRWGLTGSPASNGLMGLFGEIYVLDLGRAFGAYVTQFRFQFFNAINDYTWVLKKGAEEHIYARLRDVAIRMDAEDYLEMPTLLPHIIRVDLPPDARAIYTAMEDEMYAAIDGKLMTAANAAVASGKCRQIASGAIYPSADLGDEVTALLGKKKRVRGDHLHIHDEKMDALEDLLEELEGKQTLVAYEFQHELDRIRGRIGKDTPYIGGGVSGRRGEELELLWNSGDIPVLLVQPQSVGHGLNLQESSAAHIIWVTTTWDFELFDQLVRRLRRQGSKAKTIHCYHIIATNTVDEVVMHAQRRKEKGQRSLFDSLKARRKNTLPELE
jgi:SNF2 family DNA or RNA helicase